MTKRQYNIILIILVVAACAVATVLLALVVRPLIPPRGTPTPTPTPTALPVTGNSWERIQTSGKMIVGTAADYPPFSFYNDTFQIDGFDVALIEEVAQRMGVTTEINDMSFEGLSWALELQQIDVAIAALSITPERSASIEFSEVYYVSNDAILARSDTTITAITSVEQMAPYRIGVQRATVYSEWITRSLIDTGLMPASNLFAYERPEFAVRDLREGRIDLVAMDLAPAEVAVSQGRVILVGQDLNTQFFGIGAKKGEVVLQGEINKILQQMQADGSLSELVRQFLGTDPLPLPTPTPPGQPTATPVITPTPAACLDGMQFVQDLSFDDHDMSAPPEVTAGQSFRKGWRIRNSGTCTWDSRYVLTYLDGNSPASSMGGQPTPIQGTVPPGSEYDIWVDLVAPITPGVYQGFWGLKNPQGSTFGNRIWVGITVPSAATSTPPPTQTPSPNIRFEVNRNNILAGQCVTFTWSVQGSSAAYFYSQGEAWQQNPVSAAGSSNECPPSTTNYELRVVWQDARVEVRQITIFVEQPINAPSIDRFTADPPQIVSGQCVDLTWSVTGNISSINIWRNNVSLWGGAPNSGTMPDCPPGLGAVSYTLEASGPGGSNSSRRSVTIFPIPPEATFTPTPQSITPTPTLPIIQQFTMNPTQIEAGLCTDAKWLVTGDAEFIQIKRNGGVILTTGQFEGEGRDCPTEAGTYTYRLEAGNVTGTVFEEQVVTVTGGVTEPPLAGTPWRLVSYFDGITPGVPVIVGTELTIQFTDSGQIGGSSGCNTYTAQYTASGNSITINNVNSSLVQCTTPAGIMEQEQAYLANLERAVVYNIDNGQLSIANGVGTVLLQYQVAN